MKQFRQIEFIDAALGVFFVGAGVFIVGLLISIPVTHYYSAGVVQKQLNAQCGTDYSRFDVLVAGDKLAQLCRIENQQLTIK